jgi:hypothetical protein
MPLLLQGLLSLPQNMTYATTVARTIQPSTEHDYYATTVTGTV